MNKKTSLDRISVGFEDDKKYFHSDDDDDDDTASSNFDGNPFKLEWNFGFNPKVKLLNITTESSMKSFVTVSDHILQIFRIDGNALECLVGHESEIFVVATDEATGRFVVSADVSGVVNIWDLSATREFPYPIKSIYESQNFKKISKIAMSSDGKYLITATEGKGSLIKLWKWSCVTKDDKPQYSFEVPDNFEDVQSIQFNALDEFVQIFVLTTTNGVIFAKWDEVKMKVCRHTPVRAISITLRYVESCFIGESSKTMSVTDCGSVAIWENSESRELHQKELLKSVKISEKPLRAIKSVDRVVVIADAHGHIKFYDEDLKITFWCPSHDSIDSIIAISFDLKPKAITSVEEDESEEINKRISVRNFFIQTKSEIYAVDVSRMKFERTFYKSDDFITAIDLHPTKTNLICGANYSGRIFIHDILRRKQVMESHLQLQKRKSSTSDIDVIECPHVFIMKYSHEGHHLICGMENGLLLILDPDILTELSTIKLSSARILDLKFSEDSSFLATYDELSTVILLHRDDADSSGWVTLGKLNFHSKPICDVLFIQQPNPVLKSSPKLLPRLISLAQDRHIVEYDLLESVKGTVGLVISFSKRIFQTVFPVSMTLIYNRRLGDRQLLVADNEMKLRIFDINTFEILATFLGPIYDSHVRQIYVNPNNEQLKSRLLVFSTNKNICLYSLPLDGNPFRSLGIIGHSQGLKKFRVDARNRRIFTIGNKCNSIMVWRINLSSLQSHLEEGGNGLSPYCDLLPGGKFGSFLQLMQDLYYYMLLMGNNNFVDDRVVRDGLDHSEVADYMRGLGFFPSDYEIDCMQHELSVRGKRKINFEELVKLFINHSRPRSSRSSLEKALKHAVGYKSFDITTPITITKSNLVAILTESAERIGEKDAEIYLKEIFRSNNEKIIEEFSMEDFLQIFSRHVNPEKFPNDY